jgi:hypothetical protein
MSVRFPKSGLAGTLHHIAVQVEKGQIDAATAWIASMTGWKVRYQDDTWSLLDCGNVKLALVMADQHPPHICIMTPEAEKFGSLKIHRDGTCSCYVHGPGGVVLEVMLPVLQNG